MADDELLRWALAASVPSSRSIGSFASRVVLVALVMHADRGGHAWPGADTIATEVGGMTRRHVREAFAVLEGASLITRAGKVGRSVRWQLAAGVPATQPAGIPAEQTAAPSNEMAGIPAPYVAGNVAGNLAGIPAPNGTRRTTHARAAARPRERPPWCGHCNETTRRVEIGDDHRDGGPCPTCHPSRRTHP